jgi:hypothetical protein
MRLEATSTSIGRQNPRAFRDYQEQNDEIYPQINTYHPQIGLQQLKLNTYLSANKRQYGIPTIGSFLALIYDRLLISNPPADNRGDSKPRCATS